RIRLSELVPTLGAKAIGLVVEPLQQPQRVRIHLAARKGARGKGAKLARAEARQDRLSHDRARRIAGAEIEHVVNAGRGVRGHTTLSNPRGPQQAAGLVPEGDSGAAPSVPPPYVVLSPVVRNVSQATPCGSVIHVFSD